MEHKSFPSFLTKVDIAQGIVEHIVAVMGNRDRGNDRIHPGAFTKTLNESAGKVRVLDLHKTDSLSRVLGKPVSMREVSAAELPSEAKEQYPDATGGLWAQTQFNMDTQAGREAFAHLKAGDISEWSFGYDAINPDITKDDDGVTVRNLREVRLWEYSPVLWGMNPATATMSAKAAESEPSEGKPWKVFFEDGKYCVYKVNEAGDKVGDPLGKHDTEDEARQQVEALYANEGKSEEKAIAKQEADGAHPASHYLVVEDPQKPSTWHLRVRGMDGEPDHRLMGAAWAALHGGYRGNKYEGPSKQEAIRKLTALYKSEGIDTPKADDTEHEDKAGAVIAKRNAARLRKIRDLLKEIEDDAGLSDEPSAPAAEQPQAALIAKTAEAGPQNAPTSEVERQRLLLFADALDVEV